jgi:hypothetical protein|tara:strand:- start:304 stop:681 length:378 start_codon:yes stop_codon:yes gene_type:complete
MLVGTRKALEASIEHWENIAKGKEPSLGELNCALCARFADTHRKNDHPHILFCVRTINDQKYETCPVDKCTNSEGCEPTPFCEFVEISIENNEHYSLEFWAKTPEAKRAARKEVRFLKSLLPKEK